VAASLLLNLEAPLTMLIAVLVFREHLGRRSWLAALLILGGAAVLKLETGEVTTDMAGVILLGSLVRAGR
jgi:drug/metabolite transporter (DMT)-like permease